MAFTAKQIRNGIVGPENYTQQHPAPSTDLTSTVSGLMSESQSAAGSRNAQAEALMTSGQGAGLAGHNVGGGGNMWEWDDGLAVGEQRGEM